jgi:EXS family
MTTLNTPLQQYYGSRSFWSDMDPNVQTRIRSLGQNQGLVPNLLLKVTYYWCKYGFPIKSRSYILAHCTMHRFAQCFRRFRDTRHAFPHLVNAGKYSTTLVANLFEYLANVTVGMARHQEKDEIYNTVVSCSKILSQR